jgi:circadian clock protein KaiB
MSQLLLQVFISGDNPKHARAVAGLQAHCAARLYGAYEVEVIDVVQHPQRAVEEKVLATPALIKVRPLPVQRIIGDFSSPERVLQELGFGAAVNDAAQGS